MMSDSLQPNGTGAVQLAAAAAAVLGKPELLDPFYAQLRDQTRFWVQRVAVPCLTLVGLFGNAITIIIMTRRRMRSTTNMYLAALAFVDMLYLLLTFLLGLSHYPNVATRRWYAYWRTRPFLMMLTDACSNTSVWLTVTFTIERFVAVKYPIKGKVWCTEARAKRLIVGVFVFGILFASPVPFEWEVKEGRPKGGASPLNATTTSTESSATNTNTVGGGAGPLGLVHLYQPETAAAAAAASGFGTAGGNGDLLVRDDDDDNGNNDHDDDDDDDDKMDDADLDDRDWGRLTDDGKYIWLDLPAQHRADRGEAKKSSGGGGGGGLGLASDLANEITPAEECTLSLEYTDFGANETYKTIYYWSTAVIFCFVPLFLLTLFNGFLIRSVHSSRRKRNLMTNTHAAGQQQQQAAATAAMSCQVQRARSLRDHLKRGADKLGRARLLIKKRSCNSTVAAECKSAANGPSSVSLPPPPPSMVIIGPGRSSGPSSNCGQPTGPRQQHAPAGGGGCLRNSIIKLPANTGARCSSCAKVTFRKVEGGGRADSQSAYDWRDRAPAAPAPAAAPVEFARSETQSNPMIGVNEKVDGGDIERGEPVVAAPVAAPTGAPSHVDFTSTCDTDAGYDIQLAANRCVGDGATLAKVAQAHSVACTHQSGAARPVPLPLPPPSGQCDSKTGRRNQPARLDDTGDNKSGGKVAAGGSMENLQQFKSTLARSKSAIGGGGGHGRANGRFVGANKNHFRSHQLSFTFKATGGGRGKGASASAGAGMSNDASPLSNNSDNGTPAGAPLPLMPAPQHAAASSQERRITIMLIAVVILFLVCQIPSAGMLLYTSVHEPKPNTNESALLLAFGNIFNFLMAVNAAGNFILYSFLSKKYRNTFVTTFCKCAGSSPRTSRARGLAKSKSYLSCGSYDRQSTTTSQGRASRETSTTQHLVSSYQSTTTTTGGGGGGRASSSTSSDDTMRCSTPASLVRFYKSFRCKASGRGGGGGSSGSEEPPKACTQPLDSRLLGNGRHNRL